MSEEERIIAEFIRKEAIIEKFETLAEYIPHLHQRGHIDGLREEVDEFIEELRERRDFLKVIEKADKANL